MFDLAEHLAKLAREVNAIADEYGRTINTRQWVSQIPKTQPIIAPKWKMSFEERSRRINKLLDNRPPNVHEKPNLRNPPNEKRRRRREPETVFPILPERNYNNVRPLPEPNRISVVTQSTMKINVGNEVQIKQINKIKILQLNAHGALTHTKVAYLKELILVHRPELILVNEFGQPKDTPVFPEIETYRAISYDLKAAFSGVAIYVQAALLEIVELVQTRHGLCFSQIAGVQIQGLKIYTVYRSPNPLSSLEADNFCRWIDSLEDSNVLIIGDLNLRVDWETYQATNHVHHQIAQSLLEKNFVQYQEQKTFINSSNILDVTLCNSMNTVIRCLTEKFMKIDKVDHYPTITEIALDCDIVVEKEVRLRKKRNVEKYQIQVEKGIKELTEKYIPDLSNVIPTTSLVDNMEEDLANLLLKCEDDTVPKVKIKVNEFKPKSIDTFGPKTKSLFQKKKRLLAKGLTHKASEIQKQIDKSLEEDRAKWSQNFINDLKKDPNYIWTMVKKSTVTASSNGGIQRPDGSLTFNRQEKVQLLSDRYASVLTPKTEPTCDIDKPETCQAKHTERLSDVEFTAEEVAETLKASNASMAKDSRGLYVPLYRDARESIATYLAVLFNLSLNLCYLTLAWLVAMVIPIPKGGDLTLPKQWRGIVLEQSPVRIYEKGLNYKIIKFLERICFFHPSQFGFRWGRSCIHNLITFWSYLVGLMRDYGAVDVIYADTSAAFDRLSHGLLLDKLFHQCGITGNLWKTIKSWTTNRTQFVRWNDVDSEEIPVTSSCMQGSCLGTTCWNVYFNEILYKIEEWIDELEIEGASFYVYADDIKIIYPAIEENIPKINELLRRLQKLMDEHYLKFNADKCSVLTLGDINPNLDVFMTNDSGETIALKRTKVERDLGVLVDSDGTFNSHIKKSLAIAKATIKILSKIFFKASFDDKKKLYHAYVFSRMSYGSEIWGTNDVLVLDQFNKIYEDLFKYTEVDEGQWPPYTPEQLFVEKDLLAMYDIIHHRSPVAREEVFINEQQERPRAGPQTRSQTQERIPSQRWNRWTNTLLVERNKSRWNSIPVEVRNNPNRSEFQKYVRAEILEKLLCNQIRKDLISGELRRRSLRHKEHLEKANLKANVNTLVGNDLNIPIEEFLLDNEFRDDFLRPNLCLKKMKRRNIQKLKTLSKIAPWMLLCKCPNSTCKAELLEFEKTNKCQLRDKDRVVIVEDKAIFTDKYLLKTTKKLSDLLQCSEKFEFNN